MVLVKGTNTMWKFFLKIGTFFMVHTCFQYDLCLRETVEFYCTKDALKEQFR